MFKVILWRTQDMLKALDSSNIENFKDIMNVEICEASIKNWVMELVVLYQLRKVLIELDFFWMEPLTHLKKILYDVVFHKLKVIIMEPSSL
jgi:hypothetical protein